MFQGDWENSELNNSKKCFKHVSKTRFQIVFSIVDDCDWLRGGCPRTRHLEICARGDQGGGDGEGGRDQADGPLAATPTLQQSVSPIK